MSEASVSDIRALKELLAQHNIRPNKALGQNFFIDAPRLCQIADAARVEGENVLEIGPGPGALTEQLIPRAKRVVAVEKDAVMAALLTERFPDAENLTVITGDALRFSPDEVFQGAPFRVVGNLPYYITTPIAERYLLLLPKSLTFMLQREAAERFFARPNDRVYGPLAVLTAVLYRTERIMNIPRDCYYPQPEVDSAVIRLERRADGPESAAPSDAEDARSFFAFLNTCFHMRRKTLINNLIGYPAPREALEALGLPPAVRAEALPPETLLALYRLLRKA